MAVQAVDLKDSLKKVFGYNQFRGNQEKIIQNVLDGKNTFVIMPTGAGKSLCYQLPAVILDGVAIIVSPLIALMKNQVDQLQAFGVDARVLNSTLNKTETKKVMADTLDGQVKLLYVAPESLTKPTNVAFFKEAKVSFAAIDEAHCISEWGHDFRPEYRRIKAIIEEIGDIPIIALTATATPKVQIDIQKNLNMEAAHIFKSSFNRTNLFYEVRPKSGTKKQLIKFVKQHKGKSGIIYCLSRKKVEEVAYLLQVNDVKAVPYHAGLEAATRVKNQDGFLNEDIDVVVATIAFGMGIDKPDVRFVIHYDVPKSLEGYYQETGRAGRDGLEGNCLMFYSHNDILKLEKFSKDKPVTERDTAKNLLSEMVGYAESSVCRRKQLLHYFGEEYDEKECEADAKCDACAKPKEKFEGKEQALMVLQAVEQTKERFTIAHIANVLTGTKNEYVKSYGHDKLPIYGKGNESDNKYWSSIIRQTLLNGLLWKDIESIGIVKLSDAGRKFLDTQHSIKFSADYDYENLGEEEESVREVIDTKAYDIPLYELLKGLRKQIAKEKGFPPYVVFQDPSMEEMATVYPTTKEELAQVNGVGMGKVRKFGDKFLELINRYVDDNDIETAADVVVKSAVNKSKTKIFIIQQIDRKIDLEEIAEAKKMPMENLLSEIEHICYSGTKLNLDYYIEQIMDDEKEDDIYDYFMNSETDSLSVAVDEFEGDNISEEEIRIIRIKFLSEVAN